MLQEVSVNEGSSSLLTRIMLWPSSEFLNYYVHVSARAYFLQTNDLYRRGKRLKFLYESHINWKQ